MYRVDTSPESWKILEGVWDGEDVRYVFRYLSSDKSWTTKVVLDTPISWRKTVHDAIELHRGFLDSDIRDVRAMLNEAQGELDAFKLWLKGDYGATIVEAPKLGEV